jgi:Icc-related predicted phosphoesterase
MAKRSRVRFAAVGDLHYRSNSEGLYEELFTQASKEADLLLLCGDLTDFGLTEEAQVLAKDLRRLVRIPILAVLGNHDHESDQAPLVRRALEEGAGVQVLDGESLEFRGLGFTGVRGFGGGFGRWALNAWGEHVLKEFAREAVREREKLERALSQLDTRRQVVLLHYSPVRATCEGEALEIYPFLGSSHLEAALDRFQVTMAFHGHAHAGSPEGRTAHDVPIFNVSRPVLKRSFPAYPPFRVFEVEA